MGRCSPHRGPCIRDPPIRLLQNLLNWLLLDLIPEGLFHNFHRKPGDKRDVVFKILCYSLSLQLGLGHNPLSLNNEIFSFASTTSHTHTAPWISKTSTRQGHFPLLGYVLLSSRCPVSSLFLLIYT